MRRTCCRAAMVVFALAAASAASAQPAVTCSANVAVPPLVRNAGLSELTADIYLTCSGTAPGGGVVSNLAVFYNAPVTSRLIGGSSEALALINEPAPGTQSLGVNLFQGTVAGNSVTFLALPFSPTSAGAFNNWVVHVTNVRLNVGGGFSMIASVAVSNTAAISISNPTQTVGFVQAPLTFSTTCGSAPSTVNLNFTELFATAFRTRGSTSQNVPGTIYNTETGFTPSPFIPGVGIADTGTQLGAVFSGIPGGVTITAPSFVTAGTLALTAVSPPGGGGVSIVAGSATIIYEVVAASPLAPESVSVPLTVTQLPLAGALVRGGPFPTSVVITASATDPIPRFFDTSSPTSFGAGCSSVPLMPQPMLWLLAVTMIVIGGWMARRHAQPARDRVRADAGPRRSS